MLRRLSRSLSFRLLVIFLVLGSAFVFGTVKSVQRFYNSDQIRGLISGHLSLHVNYVREDIGVPPGIDRAVAITKKVPVDIRIFGPDVDWASDPAFPRLEQLEFVLAGVALIVVGRHGFSLAWHRRMRGYWGFADPVEMNT